jgi:hypothetical protein
MKLTQGKQVDLISFNFDVIFRAMVGLALVVKGLTFLFATLAWWFYTPPTKTKATNGIQESAATSVNPDAKTKEIYAYDNATVDRS